MIYFRILLSLLLRVSFVTAATGAGYALARGKDEIAVIFILLTILSIFAIFKE